MKYLNFSYEFKGATRLWVACIGFVLTGLAILLFLPDDLFTGQPDSELGVWAMQALGWTFVVLGVLVLIPMLLTLYVRFWRPGQEEVWYWWINFLGGLLGALTFCVPATLTFPLMLLAYVARLNPLFPAEQADPMGNLRLGLLFSVVGVVTLAVTVFLARLKLREPDKRGV